MQEDTKDEIKKAIGAHSHWKLRLKAAAKAGKTDAPVDQIARDDCCDFGHWLKKIDTSTAQDPSYLEVKRLHTEFHTCAGEVAKLIESGKPDAALNDIDSGAFMQKSTELITALTRWRHSI